MGKEVTVHDVFAKATRALQERIAALEPLKSLYNTQNRVIIANTYLIPLLSYLMRFFFMGEDNMSEVERSLARWCVPGRRFTYEHLTAPKQQAGLHQPLRDLFRTNISSVLSNKCATSLPDQQRQVRGFSMLMSEHLTKAAFSFHHLTEAWPRADASQKDLYKMLSSSDETHLVALADKLNPADPEKKIGKDAAKQICQRATNLGPTIEPRSGASLPRF